MRVFLFISCLLSALILISAKPKPKFDTFKCGYQSCHPVNLTGNTLNVHLVPHSHDDVGWLKTVDQYFYGSATKYQFAGVQYIISSVIQSLQLNSDRRFIQVETAFFWQWWKQQSKPTQEIVRNLVNQGRLEIVNGAWSMNDEAATHYQSIIDQFTWGLRMINDTLGECGRPKIGWQIDPFGHSREMASIFSQLGYEAMFFARLDYRDSEKRHNNKTLETMWQGSPSLGKKSNLFTGVLYDFYTTPAYFCWDVLCSDVPINDDPESPDFNQDIIVQQFADYVEKGAKYYQTNNLLVTMGGDFTYQAAEMFYINMDKLIAGFKKYRLDINIIYSTPSCYVKAVNDAAKLKKISFPLKTDDFFPYASGNHSYWSGYFTSRPNSKRFERQGNNFLQVVKQLSAFSNKHQDKLILLKEVMGIMQHHDAITGTEKQHVADDYVRLMDKAFKQTEKNISEIIHGLLNSKFYNINININITYESCLLSNISYCRTSNEDEFTVAVYNPLSRNVSHYVHLPVNGTGFRFNITGSRATNMTYDLRQPIANFSTTHNIAASTHNLIFRAEVPALGFAYFHIKKLKAYETQATLEEMQIDEVITPPEINQDASGTVFVGNANGGVSINTTTGKLSQVTLNNRTIPVTQDFFYYLGRNGTNYGENNRASGAYIFRPVENTTAIKISDNCTYKIFNSGQVYEIHQNFSSWLKQIIRVYPNESFIEFDWLVGPVPLSNYGIEVITRISSNLQSNSTFYTDSNGRELIKRVRNHRETYNYTNEEPIAGNYYPVTSKISIREDKQNIELSLLNDRAQGGSSLKDGEVELMLYRRLLNDDAFGVGEALNESEFGHSVMVRGQSYLVIANITTKNNQPNAANITADLAQRKILAPWTFLGKINKAITVEELKQKLNFNSSELNYELPKSVQILTLEPWTENPPTLLLRLEHVLEGEKTPTTINLKNLFKKIKIKSAYEKTLGANQYIEENEKLQWNITNSPPTAFDYVNKKKPSKPSSKIDLSKISLAPMEIRTFICYL